MTRNLGFIVISFWGSLASAHGNFFSRFVSMPMPSVAFRPAAAIADPNVSVVCPGNDPVTGQPLTWVNYQNPNDGKTYLGAIYPGRPGVVLGPSFDPNQPPGELVWRGAKVHMAYWGDSRFPVGQREMESFIGDPYANTFGGRFSYAAQGGGVVLDGANEGTPAHRLGLTSGDTILSINDKPINSVYQYVNEVHRTPDNQKMKFVVRRRSGEVQTMETALNRKKSPQQREMD